MEGNTVGLADFTFDQSSQKCNSIFNKDTGCLIRFSPYSLVLLVNTLYPTGDHILQDRMCD